ncbi:pro-Pol polyprotein [Trichonephila clavipes]|nr:pro-Pol polyprotein [Trichonephila clavipes]
MEDLMAANVPAFDTRSSYNTAKLRQIETTSSVEISSSSSSSSRKAVGVAIYRNINSFTDCYRLNINILEINLGRKDPKTVIHNKGQKDNINFFCKTKGKYIIDPGHNAIDLFGPLPETTEGMKWIFIVEDYRTKWVELSPLKQAIAKECTMILLNEVSLRYGVPRRLISDNGTQFVSAVIQQLCFVLDINQSHSRI